MTQEEKEEILEELKDWIKDSLSIEVEGYYDAYSGQCEHYHRVIINWY